MPEVIRYDGFGPGVVPGDFHCFFFRLNMNLTDLTTSRNDTRRVRAATALPASPDSSIVVPVERIPAAVVGLNSRLVYLDETLGVRRQIVLVLHADADPASGRFSVLAPVGKALLGLTAGAVIDCECPDGSVHRLRVEQVWSAAE